jgi:hypothetical protein
MLYETLPNRYEFRETGDTTIVLFLYEHKYTPNGNFRISLQNLSKIRSRKSSVGTVQYLRVSRKSWQWKPQFTLRRKWISVNNYYIFADFDNIGTKALRVVSLSNFR